ANQEVGQPEQADAQLSQPPEAEVGTAADSDPKVENGGEVGSAEMSENVGVNTANDENVTSSQAHEEEGNSTTAPEEAETIKSTEDTDQQGEEQQQQQHEQQQPPEKAGDSGDVTDAHAPSVEPSEGEIPSTPAPPASRQSEYEEDFSETSNLASSRNTPAESKPEEGLSTEKEADEKAKDKDDKKSISSSSSSSSSAASTPEPKHDKKTTSPLPAESTGGGPEPSQSSGPPATDGEDKPAPLPPTGSGEEDQPQEEKEGEGTVPEAHEEGEERVDSRAEAAQVIPIPPPEPETKKADVDGRSSGAGGEEMADAEVFRGEDRTEMIAPEGSEDCRGQGQWKSAEQQAISAAMLVSKSERELTEEAVRERDTLRHDHDALKSQLLALEAEVDRKNEQLLVDREILARKDKEIADLQSELDNSNSAAASNEADQSRVKDLQERLAILARENEDKDKRFFKLEAELKETQTRLRETERRLIHAESHAVAEPPKSKTCVIM
ncbi:hypothetical protein EGW08_011086, partial [Elysia chlorotica]